MGWHTLDAIGLLNLLGTFESLLVAVVPYRHVRTRLGEGLCNRQTDTGTGTGYNGRLALVGEQRQDLLLLWWGGVVVAEVPSFHRRFSHDDVFRVSFGAIE